MKIWDKNKTKVPSFSEALGIKKGDVVQIAGSGGKTTLSYTIANENSHLKVAVVTTTKRFAPKENAVLLDENEKLDITGIKGNFAEIGVLDEIGKIGWIGDENYAILKEWADIVVVEADGSKRLPLKACAEYEPVFLPDATKTVVVCGLSAIGKPIEDVCHRYALVKDDIAEGTAVSEEEILLLLNRYYKNRYPSLDITFILNQADTDELLAKAMNILSDIDGFACKMI
ncbi:MAG: putative selenium-dependent hydroxylase accessory protein YqeC [Lachnospiraceae bacterium]|nr:putative selenium-dependent hydroxylase accessory protein YqeC [Lachnospiraceae bacterium]